MKKVSFAFAFDIMIVALLFGNTLSTNELRTAAYWNEFTTILLIASSVILLLRGIVQRIKY